MQATTATDWPAAQAAVERAGARVTVLLRSARRLNVPAVGQWTLTDVAAHLSHALDGISAMAMGGGGALDEIWGLSTLTTALVAGETHRSLPVLADRIEATVARLLALMAEAGEDAPRTWLVRGTELPLSALTCHALNELVVHGRDIAVAEGVPWPIERSDGALIVCGFLLPALGRLGRAMVNPDTAADARVTYDLRVRGGGRFVLRFDAGDFSVEPGPPTTPVDCHLLVEPAAFMLVAWGRISQWRAIPRGQLLAWGRRPWLGLKLRSMLKNP
jgi:hypothetical protein